MSAAGPRAQLEQTLDRARTRIVLRSRVERSAWLALGALLSVEAGLGVARAVSLDLTVASLVVAALLLVLAGAALALGRRPSRVETARAVDLLSGGAALESGAEALEGKGGRFAPLLIDEAALHARGLDLGGLLPLRAPRTTSIGAALGLLLLIFVVAPARESRPARGRGGVGLEAPGRGGAAAKNGTTAAPDAAGSGTRGPGDVVAPGEGASPPPVAVAPRVTPEEARDLARRLESLARSLASNPSATAPDQDHASRAIAEAELLEDALAKGDAAAADRAARALEELSKAGVAAGAAAKVARATRALEARSAESGAHASGTTTRGQGPAGSASARPLLGNEDSGAGHAGRLPWRLRVAAERYLGSGTGSRENQ